MSNRSKKLIRAALKKAPEKVNVSKVKAAIKLVELPDAMQRAQSLLGDVNLEKRRPTLFEGFVYVPLKSKIAFGKDGSLYGDRFSSTCFFYGSKKLYAYSRTVCYDTDVQEESLADFRYHEIIGVEFSKTILSYRSYTKRSEKEHKQDITIPLREKNTGVSVPVIKFVLTTYAGERTYYLNSDADKDGAFEAFVKELRALLDSKDGELLD
ncbi:MAG: hypothetical protein E7363_04255 [Clostridiales bacterium]|nr:hypothetical protein [Clostridiales bacterium]